MARIYPQELHYKFERVLKKAFRGKPTSLALVDDVVRDLIEEVPGEAYEAINPPDNGHLTWHGEIERENVTEWQNELLSIHLSLKRDVPIQVTISTTGGWDDATLSLISAVQRVQRDGRAVNIHVAGYAYSAGSVIVQVGSRRTIDASGWLMLHEASWSANYQKGHLHRDDLEQMERVESAIISFYTTRTGKPESYYRKKWNRRDVYMTAEEALTDGLVDEVLKAPTYRRRRADSR